jgi:hypothetical protein
MAGDLAPQSQADSSCNFRNTRRSYPTGLAQVLAVAKIAIKNLVDINAPNCYNSSIVTNKERTK